MRKKLHDFYFEKIRLRIWHMQKHSAYFAKKYSLIVALISTLCVYITQPLRTNVNTSLGTFIGEIGLAGFVLSAILIA